MRKVIIILLLVWFQVPIMAEKPAPQKQVKPDIDLSAILEKAAKKQNFEIFLSLIPDDLRNGGWSLSRIKVKPDSEASFYNGVDVTFYENSDKAEWAKNVPLDKFVRINFSKTDENKKEKIWKLLNKDRRFKKIDKNKYENKAVGIITFGYRNIQIDFFKNAKLVKPDDKLPIELFFLQNLSQGAMKDFVKQNILSADQYNLSINTILYVKDAFRGGLKIKIKGKNLESSGIKFQASIQNGVVTEFYLMFDFIDKYSSFMTLKQFLDRNNKEIFKTSMATWRDVEKEGDDVVLYLLGKGDDKSEVILLKVSDAYALSRKGFADLFTLSIAYLNGQENFFIKIPKIPKSVPLERLLSEGKILIKKPRPPVSQPKNRK